MQKNWLKRFAALALCAVLICAELVIAPSTAKADTAATYGNAVTDTMFYVTSAGLGSVTLSQSGMGLAEKQSTKNTQTTSEYIYAQYMVLYKGNMDAYWQQAAYWDQKTCVINFYRADVYTIRVLPMALQNIQATGNWSYTRWLTVPAWYVSGVKNCAISSVNPAAATPTPTKKPTAKPTATPTPAIQGTFSCMIFYQTVDGRLLSWEQRYLNYGLQLVLPNRTFNGYALVGDGAYYVTVDANGVSSPQSIVFLYQEIAAPTPTPTKKPTKKPTATPTKKPVTGYLTILFETMDGKLLDQERRLLYAGTQLVLPDHQFSGYALVGDAAYYVTVGSNGVVSPQSIVFRYQRIATATKKPTKKPTATPTKKPVTGYLTVLYETVDGKLLDQERRLLHVGTHLVLPDRQFKGYVLINDGDQYATVNSRGTVMPDTITFLYQRTATKAPTKKPTATPKPTKKPTPKPTKKPTAKPTAAPVHGKIVEPVGWDTLFKGNSKNATRYKSVANLFDNDRSTVLKWTIWSSEVNKPIITVYFGGATIGAIGFRNGNAASQKEFNSFARGYRYTARIYLTNGNHYDNSITLDPDTYRTDYQVIALKKIYKNVDHIEIILHKWRGGTTNKNATAIADLRFYTEP